AGDDHRAGAGQAFGDRIADVERVVGDDGAADHPDPGLGQGAPDLTAVGVYGEAEQQLGADDDELDIHEVGSGGRILGGRWRLPGAALGEQPTVPVHVHEERVDRENGGDGEGDRHEAAVEGVPEIGEAAGLPAHRLPRIAEGKPEHDG